MSHTPFIKETIQEEMQIPGVSIWDLLKKMDIWHISQNMERQEKDSWSFIEIFIPPAEFQEIPYYTQFSQD